jgi:probable rRNA maturation factor
MMQKERKPHSARGTTPIIMHHAQRVRVLPDQDILCKWIMEILKQEHKALGSLSLIFLDDPTLRDINKRFLKHDYYTDIITFPYTDDPLEAEVYISTDRVRANARKYRVPLKTELLRVIAHGVLHLCGWNDKSKSQSILMRKREDASLRLLGIGKPV